MCHQAALSPAVSNLSKKRGFKSSAVNCSVVFRQNDHWSFIMSKSLSEQQAAIFKALGHASRLMMVKALGTGDKCVNELHELVGGDLSTISKHLTVLKNAGIVETYKQGNFVFYHLTLQCVSTFIRCLENASPFNENQEATSHDKAGQCRCKRSS